MSLSANIERTPSTMATIKESLFSIFKQLAASPKARPTNDMKVTASRVYNYIAQESKPSERLYFIYLICHLSSSSKSSQVDKLLKMMLPNPLTTQAISFMSDLINFALCHCSNYTTMLDSLSVYLITNEFIIIELEYWFQAQTLALDSPSFCSALISRADLPKLGINKKLLAIWLQDLSRTDNEFPPPNLVHLIKYSLFHEKDQPMSREQLRTEELTKSDVHFGILTLIQSKRCQMLTSQFLVDVATELRHKAKSNDPKARVIVDRYAQILSVATANKVASKTASLKTALSDLESNQLIASVIKWQNK